MATCDLPGGELIIEYAIDPTTDEDSDDDTILWELDGVLRGDTPETSMHNLGQDNDSDCEGDADIDVPAFSGI